MDVSGFAMQVIRESWCLWPDFLAETRVAGLAQVLHEHRERGEFDKAGIGRGTRRSVRHDIRGDHVLWLDDCAAALVQQFVSNDLEELRLAFNVAGYLGLHEFEGHFAVYPPDTGYARHLDRFRDDDARIVSLVLYLNQDWQDGDGGELRLYPGAGTQQPIAVLPTGGTLVGFLSAEVPHEVLPSRRDRFSLTGWFRRRP